MCTTYSCELAVVPWILADSIIYCHLTRTEKFKDWFIHSHKSYNECTIPHGTQLYIPNSPFFQHTILLSVSPSLRTPFLTISCTSIVRCFVVRVFFFQLALFSSHFSYLVPLSSSSSYFWAVSRLIFLCALHFVSPFSFCFNVFLDVCLFSGCPIYLIVLLATAVVINFF